MLTGRYGVMVPYDYLHASGLFASKLYTLHSRDSTGGEETGGSTGEQTHWCTNKMSDASRGDQAQCSQHDYLLKKKKKKKSI